LEKELSVRVRWISIKRGVRRKSAVSKMKEGKTSRAECREAVAHKKKEETNATVARKKVREFSSTACSTRKV